MAKGKYQSAGRLAGRSLAVILAMILICGGVVGGTVAWLIANPDPVVNTFTYGDINIRLEETDTNLDGDNDPNTNEYEMMPGQEIAKDPTVTVEVGSENSWLFVKLEKSENFDQFMHYTIAEGWAQLYDAEGNQVEGVYYRYQAGIDEEAEDAEEAVIHVLKDDKVTVKDEVTKEMLNALDPEGEEATYPTLTVTAYAVQYVGFEAEVSEGAEEATAEQVNAAALKAWTEVLEAQESEADDPVTEETP